MDISTKRSASRNADEFFLEGDAVIGRTQATLPFTKKSPIEPGGSPGRTGGQNVLSYGLHELENDGTRDFRWSRRFFGFEVDPVS
jgi:hypothetical protein